MENKLDLDRVKMKVSVVMPTFNGGKYIADALRSILSQTYSPYEVVVVDDGSTDNTKDIIDGISGNIIYKKIDNAGCTQARRVGIGLCSGDWIALCDSDDVWISNHLELFVDCIKHFPEVNSYFSNFDLLDDSSFNKFLSSPDGWWEGACRSTNKGGPFLLLNQDAYVDLLNFFPIFPSGQIFSRVLYDDIGGIPENMDRVSSEDSHLTRRLVSIGVTACTSKISFSRREHENNISNDYLKKLSGRVYVLCRLCKNREIPEIYIEPTLAELVSSRRKLFNHYYWSGNDTDAVQVFSDLGVRNFNFIEMLRYVKSIWTSRFS